MCIKVVQKWHETGLSDINQSKCLEPWNPKILVVHSLQPEDFMSRLNYCNWLFINIHESTVDLQLLWWIKAVFISLVTLIYRTCTTGILKIHLLTARPHYMIKVLVYDVLYMLREITSHRLHTPLLYIWVRAAELMEKEESYVYFQQDNVPAHIAENSMWALQTFWWTNNQQEDCGHHVTQICICSFYACKNLKQKVDLKGSWQ